MGCIFTRFMSLAMGSPDRAFYDLTLRERLVRLVREIDFPEDEPIGFVFSVPFGKKRRIFLIHLGDLDIDRKRGMRTQDHGRVFKIRCVGGRTIVADLGEGMQYDGSLPRGRVGDDYYYLVACRKEE